jgi:hypothetical protein
MGRLPDFIIVGAQKGGTIAASRNLSQHPSIDVGPRPFSEYETHFFDSQPDWQRGVDWYAARFGSDKPIIGDDNPDILHQHDAHARLAYTLPHAKIIVLLRNPVDRAFSQWNHWANTPAPEGGEPWRSDWLGVTFQKAWDTLGNLSSRGCYVAHLRSLARLYPRRNIYVAVSERIRADMARQYGLMFAFLGADTYRADSLEYEERHVRQYAEPMSAEVRSKITEYYHPHNAELFEWLGYEIKEWTGACAQRP